MVGVGRDSESVISPPSAKQGDNTGTFFLDVTIIFDMDKIVVGVCALRHRLPVVASVPSIRWIGGVKYHLT